MNTATKLRRGTFQHVEAELYAYQDTIKEIARLREEILYASPEPDRVGGGRSNTSPDAQKRLNQASNFSGNGFI